MGRKDNPDPLKIELYDLQADPGEQNDIAADHPEVVAKVEAIMRKEHTPSKLFPVRVLENP